MFPFLDNARGLASHLIEVWRIFEKERNISQADAFLSTLHLLDVIGSSLKDIDRMVSLHQPPDQLPDRHKYAGFVAKWVAKVRPIQFPKNKAVNLTNEEMLKLNAQFSVFVMNSFLECLMPRTIARHMVYWFSFRDERGETLAMIAYCAEEIAVRGGAVVSLSPNATP